ncbi:MAG: MarC family protein [Thermodesulfobacteriota bacterium]
MVEIAVVSLATFFATIGPIDVAAMFAALTGTASSHARQAMARRGTLIAAVILFAFALLGETLLAAFGISLAALRTAGGILLLLIGIEMVFARPSGATSATSEETHEAEAKNDISVFPLATPLIAGPGAIGASILLMADVQGDVVGQLVVLSSLTVILFFTYLALLGATRLMRLLGVTGMRVISRVFGVLLCGLAVQFIFDGIRQSGLLTG